MYTLMKFYGVLLLTTLIILSTNGTQTKEDFRIQWPDEAISISVQLFPTALASPSYDARVLEDIVDIPENSTIYTYDYYVDTHTDENIFFDDTVDLSAFKILSLNKDLLAQAQFAALEDSNDITLSTSTATSVLSLPTPTWTFIFAATNTLLPTVVDTPTVEPFTATFTPTNTVDVATPTNTRRPSTKTPTNTPTFIFIPTPVDTAIPSMTPTPTVFFVPTITPTRTSNGTIPQATSTNGTIPQPTRTYNGTLPVFPGGTIP